MDFPKIELPETVRDSLSELAESTRKLAQTSELYKKSLIDSVNIPPLEVPNYEPIDYATDEKLDEVIKALSDVAIIQNRIIEEIKLSSDDSTKYSKKTLRVAWITIAISALVGIAQIVLSILK